MPVIVPTSPQNASQQNTPPGPNVESAPGNPVLPPAQKPGIGGLLAGVFGNSADPMAVPAKLIEIGRIIRQSGTGIQELNKSVSDLEHAAPGFSNLVKELGSTFDAALKAFPGTNIPESLKPVHRDFAAAVGNFKEFSAAYDGYVASTKLPATDLSSITTKATAALKVKQEWDEFQVSWEKLKTHAPAGAILPGIRRALSENAPQGSTPRLGLFAPPQPNSEPNQNGDTPPPPQEPPRRQFLRRFLAPRE